MRSIERTRWFSQRQEEKERKRQRFPSCFLHETAYLRHYHDTNTAQSISITGRYVSPLHTSYFAIFHHLNCKRRFSIEFDFVAKSLVVAHFPSIRRCFRWFFDGNEVSRKFRLSRKGLSWERAFWEIGLFLLLSFTLLLRFSFYWFSCFVVRLSDIILLSFIDPTVILEQK